MGMGGMGMGGMGMMGGGMGMMGGGMGMGGGGGGDTEKAPPIEIAPDLTRAEYIQLGTDLVGRPEVSGQPQTEIRGYLTRKLGLTHSETTEVMRSAGFGEDSGDWSDRRGHRELAAVARQDSDTSPPAPAAAGGTAAEGGKGDELDALQELFQGSSGLLSAPLAYAAAAATAAPALDTWKGWFMGPSAEEVEQRVYRAYEQQILQSAAAMSPATALSPSAAVGSIVVPTNGPSMIQRLLRSSAGKGLLILLFGCWLLRAELQPVFAGVVRAVLGWFGLVWVDPGYHQRLEDKMQRKNERRRKREIAAGAELTPEEELAAMQMEKGSLKEQLAAVRKQMTENEKMLKQTRALECNSPAIPGFSVQNAIKCGISP